MLQALHGPQLPQPVFADARPCQRSALAFDKPTRFANRMTWDTTLARVATGNQRNETWLAASTTMT